MEGCARRNLFSFFYILTSSLQVYIMQSFGLFFFFAPGTSAQCIYGFYISPDRFPSPTRRCVP